MLSINLLKKNNWLSDSIYLILLLTIFYNLWLGAYPVFTPDEGRYSEVAREMVATGDYITPRVNGVAFLDKPILYYWLQAIAVRLFGVTEWALRLFPMLFGLLGCIVTYLCGRALFDRRTGLISAGILATTPLYFAATHYADLNLEVAVLISCTLLFFITAIQSKHPLGHYFFFAAYISSALAFLTKGLIGIALPGMVSLAWLLLLNRWDILRKIHLIKGLILFLIITLPWYILIQKTTPLFSHYFFVTQQVTRFLSTAEFNNPSPLWFYIPIVLIGLFPWTIFLVQSVYQSLRLIWQRTSNYPTELFLLLWPLVIIIFFSIPHSKTIGYILPIFPALALLIGNYLAQIWELKPGKATYWSAGIFLIMSSLLAATLFTLSHYNWIDTLPGFKPYTITIAITILASAILACLSLKKSILFLFATCLSCNIFFLLTLTHGASYLNLNSVKPLITELKPILRPHDEVMSYFKYYQDIPLYLGKRITIVADWNAPNILQKDNWVREFWFGMPCQNTSDWLITEDRFWQRWEENKRVFVFLNSNYFLKFKATAKHYFYLGKTNDIILLSNQPTLISNNQTHHLDPSHQNPLLFAASNADAFLPR